MKIALIDHYDSFTFNVLDWLASGTPPLDVDYVAADDLASLEALAAARVPLVISPGPKRPEDFPATLRLLERSLGRVPIFGVCLGHQMLAHLAGARIDRAAAPFHGSTREIRPLDHERGLFRGISSPFRAATYNSLVVRADTLPPPWRVTALCDEGEIQGLAWDPPGAPPALGVQFHPESFLSQARDPIRKNFYRIIDEFCRSNS